MATNKKESVLKQATVECRFYKLVKPADYEGIKVEMSVTRTCADTDAAVSALSDELSEFVQLKTEKFIRNAIKRHRSAKKKGVY